MAPGARAFLSPLQLGELFPEAWPAGGRRGVPGTAGSPRGYSPSQLLLLRSQGLGRGPTPPPPRSWRATQRGSRRQYATSRQRRTQRFPTLWGPAASAFSQKPAKGVTVKKGIWVPHPLSSRWEGCKSLHCVGWFRNPRGLGLWPWTTEERAARGEQEWMCVSAHPRVCAGGTDAPAHHSVGRLGQRCRCTDGYAPKGPLLHWLAGPKVRRSTLSLWAGKRPAFGTA